jgi:hypothetical protein
MKKLAAILVLVLCIVGAAYAQTVLNLPPGSKVYIEPMNGFENYLVAALQKKKVQVVVVADRGAADFVITGSSQHEKAGWAKVAFSTISIRTIRPAFP